MKLLLVALNIYLISCLALADIKACTLDWAKDGAVQGVNSAWGVGISTSKDPVQAQQEAKTKAFSDISLQLKSSVQTSMTLTETEKTTAYNGLSSVENKMDAITGMKTVKEGSDAASGISYCIAVKLDVGAAYEIPQGKMKALTENLKLVATSLDQHKYLEVLKLSSNAKKQIDAAKDDIALADVYKAYLKEQGPTWNEQFSSLIAKMKLSEKTAKDNVVFVLPTGQYDEAFVDVESMLSGQGYSVVNKIADVEKGKIPVAIEIKQIGTLRKTRSALGETVVATIAVFLKDGTTKKLLASNKGAEVVGTGQNEVDAITNVSRQLGTHIVDVVQEGLPGVVQDQN